MGRQKSAKRPSLYSVILGRIPGAVAIGTNVCVARWHMRYWPRMVTSLNTMRQHLRFKTGKKEWEGRFKKSKKEFILKILAMTQSIN